jgi:hypothetical protein
MIWGNLEEPNFKFNATDEQGYVHEFFCRADSEDEVRRRLVRKGLIVNWVKPYSFSEWKDRARKATDKVIWQRIRNRWTHFGPQAAANWPWMTAADLNQIAGEKKKLVALLQSHDGTSEDEATKHVESWTASVYEEAPQPGQLVPKTAIKFNDDVWKEMKWHLFEQFHGKCAYCESKPLAVYPGDVEHYRPKGKVDEDENHPGYYWLAYDEQNMLPACASCNQWRAKLTHFPVSGAHSRDWHGVAAEQPLLLNPYDHNVNPLDHLEFGSTGATKARNTSPNGDNSRKYYYLDRPGLGEARFEAMKLVEQDWNTRTLRGSITEAYKELRTDILRGERPYCAAQLWELDRLRKRTIAELSAAEGI